MNLHERGRRLSARVTGWIGVVAVIAASAIGLHTWADVQATKAQANTSANTSAYTPAGSGGLDDEGSDDEGGGDDGSESNESDDSGASQQSNIAPGQLVLPGNGGPSQATTNGS